MGKKIFKYTIITIIINLIFSFICSAQMTRKSNLGPSVVHRNAVQTDDTAATLTGYETIINAAIAANTEPTSITNRDHSINTVFSASGYTHLKVFCDVYGANPSWDVTPYYWEASGARFWPGTATTVDSDQIYTVVADQAKYMFMYCDSGSGGINIYLQGIEERSY